MIILALIGSLIFILGLIDVMLGNESRSVTCAGSMALGAGVVLSALTLPSVLGMDIALFFPMAAAIIMVVIAIVFLVVTLLDIHGKIDYKDSDEW